MGVGDARRRLCPMTTSHPLYTLVATLLALIHPSHAPRLGPDSAPAALPSLKDAPQPRVQATQVAISDLL